MASPPALSKAERTPRGSRPASRRGNWWALGVGTLLGGAGLILYGGAWTTPEPAGGLMAVAVGLALVALLAVAWISGREEGSKRALQAAILMVLLALPAGLLSRLAGAALGLGVGVVITLNPPPFADLFRNRLVAVLLGVAYAYLLLRFVPPAGVMTAAVLPPLAVGMADELSAWRSQRSG